MSDLREALDGVLPDWRNTVEELGQLPLIRARCAGWRPNDEEAVQALLLAYLSAMTDWRKIQAARHEFQELLGDWTPPSVAALSNRDLQALLRWFLTHGLGSVLLRKQVVWLRDAAGVLVRMQQAAGTVDGFLSTRLAQGDDLAWLLGDTSSEWKLPGVGIALAAEFLKNLGFDDFKPDRHINRILGPSRLSLCSKPDSAYVRRRGLELASQAGILAAELDQMLWLYCARGYGATCSANPKCGRCRLRNRCRMRESAAAGPRSGHDLPRD